MTLKVIVVNASSTLTNITKWFVAALCLIMDVWTYGQMDIWTDRPTDGQMYVQTDGYFYRVY